MGVSKVWSAEEPAFRLAEEPTFRLAEEHPDGCVSKPISSLCVFSVNWGMTSTTRNQWPIFQLSLSRETTTP